MPNAAVRRKNSLDKRSAFCWRQPPSLDQPLSHFRKAHLVSLRVEMLIIIA
jgi:hypothetical protein